MCTPLQAATGETGLIRRLRRLMKALAVAIPIVANDPEACEALVNRAPADEPVVHMVGFVQVNSVIVYSSVGKTFDFSGKENFCPPSARMEQSGLIA